MPTIFKHVVTMNGVTFNDPGTKPVEAQAWILDVMEGWKTSPEPKVYSTELGGNRDGEATGDYFPLPARFIVVGGAVYAPTEAAAEELHDKLLAEAMPRNKRFDLVRNESVPKYVTCKRSGAFETEWVMENGFRWQTTLMAEDPLKYAVGTEYGTAGVAGVSDEGIAYPVVYPLVYSTEDSEDGSAGIQNEGNAPSGHIQATILGPLVRGAWRLRNDTNDGEISFDVGLALGDTLLIDFETELAYLNGYPVSAALIGSFWKIDPGTNSIRLYADYDPATSFSVLAQSAWE